MKAMSKFMKVIVQQLPDAAEQALDDLDLNDFVEDDETYCYFSQEVFMKEIMEYIEKKYPKKLKKEESLLLKSFKDKDGQLIKFSGGAAEFLQYQAHAKLIHKYWHKYDKVRNKFHLYKGEIYSYKLLGCGNIGNEIQLIKYNNDDLVKLVNNQDQRKTKWYKRFNKTERFVIIFFSIMLMGMGIWSFLFYYLGKPEFLRSELAIGLLVIGLPVLYFLTDTVLETMRDNS